MVNNMYREKGSREKCYRLIDMQNQVLVCQEKFNDTMYYKLNSLVIVSEYISFLDTLYFCYIGFHFIERNK